MRERGGDKKGFTFCYYLRSSIMRSSASPRAPYLPEKLLPLSELVYSRCLIAARVLILMNTENKMKGEKNPTINSIYLQTFLNRAGGDDKYISK